MRKKYTRLPLDKPLPAFKNEPVLWMPFLMVRVGKGHERTPRIPAVVDSGSPYCIFRASVADYLGIDILSGVKDMVGGIIGGLTDPIYFHKVKLFVESDWIVEIKAGFVKKLAVAGILGRNGFFDNFYVNFNHSQKPPEMEITRIEPIQ